MKEINYTGLLPQRGVVAVLGKEIEEPLIRAVSYAREEGKDIEIVPLTPQQAKLGINLGIPLRRGYPDFFYAVVDFEVKDGLFTVGNYDYPMLFRLYEMGSGKTLIFLRRKYHTISVEYTSFLREEIEPIISLYGEIVARRENEVGHTVVDIVPVEEDLEELRRLLKEVPGVVEVGIFPILPYRRILLK